MSVFIFPPAAAAAQTFLTTSTADYTEIGTSGKVADGTGNALDFTIDNGQTAAVTGDGLSGLIGAALWDRGAVSATAPVTLKITLSSPPNASRLCVVMGIGTVPTSLATIKSGNPYWAEVYVNGAGGVNTRCKVGTATLLSANQENATNSTDIVLQVVADDIGYGPGHVSHRHDATRSTHDQATKYTHTSGNLWIAALWGKSATAGSEETLTATIEVLS